MFNRNLANHLEAEKLAPAVNLSHYCHNGEQVPILATVKQINLLTSYGQSFLLCLINFFPLRLLFLLLICKSRIWQHWDLRDSVSLKEMREIYQLLQQMCSSEIPNQIAHHPGYCLWSNEPAKINPSFLFNHIKISPSFHFYP